MTQPEYTVQSVDDLHKLCDRDSSTIAVHHTLGYQSSQASPGDHTHNGRDSKKLNAGTVTGSRGGNVALASLLTVLANAGIIINNSVV